MLINNELTKERALPTKAVRFSEKENDAIQEFLKKNPYFDFSTIARIAILSFLEDPKIVLTPNNKKNADSKSVRNH